LDELIFPQVALVYGQMNEPPGARARVALTGLTVAEYFRDQEGQDVLLFIDNIFRFTQAGSEVSPFDCKLCALFPFLQTLESIFCVTVHHHLIYLFSVTSSLCAVHFKFTYICPVLEKCILSAGVCPPGPNPLCRGLPANLGH